MKSLSPDRTRTHYWLTLLAIFSLGLGLRIADYVNKPCLSLDSALYVDCAEAVELPQSVRNGFWRLPHIYFLKIGPRLGMRVQDFGVAVNIFCGAFAGVLIMAVARRAAIPGGFWAGLMLATFPKFIDWSTEVQRDMPFIVFVLASLYYFFAALDAGSIWYGVLSAAALFFAFLMRVEAIDVILALTAADIAIVLRYKRYRTLLDVAVRVAVLAVLFTGYFFAISYVAGSRPDVKFGQIMHNWKLRR